MTTLPAGIPRLDALVHATATRYAQELQARCRYPFSVHNPHPAEWEGYIEDIGGLLRDLTRRESRDWAACALAGLVGVEVGDTAPSWTRRQSGPLVVQWRLSTPTGSHLFGDLSVHFTDQTAVHGISEDGPTALTQALAAVCRDG